MAVLGFCVCAIQSDDIRAHKKVDSSFSKELSTLVHCASSYLMLALYSASQLVTRS